MASPIRVMIIDDHAMVRAGMRLVIEAQRDMVVVGEAGSLTEAIEIAGRTNPDVLTLDLSMPGPSGVESVERLRRAAPRARIVIVTMHDDPTYVRSAVALGASGFVSKSAADSELVTAIRSVARGRAFIDVGAGESLEHLLFSRPRDADDRSPASTLSEREREVLAAVARGFSNQQIADRIGLSVKTVESYRSRLMRKLKLKDRAELVQLALDMGLLEPGPGT